MINTIYAALPMRKQTEKTTRAKQTEKTTRAKLNIYIGVGSRNFIDEAHTLLGIFPVFFPCMLPTPLCVIFWILFRIHENKYQSQAVAMELYAVTDLYENGSVLKIYL